MQSKSKASPMFGDLPNVPGCECLPNKQVVGTVQQLFTWLLIQCTIIGTFGKHTSCGNTEQNSAAVIFPNSMNPLTWYWRNRKCNFNPLNAELNHICHLLALLGTRHILHVSRIGVTFQVSK
jgi:hypothetical protein